ncbi:hypothetical protein BCR44DRAFT_41774 [Catenaria anguillulae PL171]|uniref:Ankyrin repeat-containing domain protein n=1 Tax=Catenaria anguillulae PL171 TaxID=765915 RepID=A0A1Y2HGL7_9FUNG|nr:hypothetical protein BCR44DRAFT_41774 [Catenaria anguillulae PL171]
MAPLAALVRMTHSSDSQSPLLAACATGRVDVLESKWDVWDGKAVRMEAAQVASEFGQVHILVWLHQHGHIRGSMEYGVLINDCLNQASARGHVFVLQWWRDCGLTDLYMHEPLSVRTAVSHGQVNVLDWWMANVPAGLSGIPATAGSWGALAQLATEAGHASELEQILQRRGPARLREEWDRIQYVCSLFDAVELSTPGMALFDSLWWLMHSDLDTSQVQVDIIYGAAGECAAFWNPLLLDMCRRAGYLKRSLNLDRVILASMSVLVLEWAAAYSKLALEYTHEALTSLTKETCIPILEWWRHSGLPVKFAVEDLQQAHFDDAIRTWWLESGLL